MTVKRRSLLVAGVVLPGTLLAGGMAPALAAGSGAVHLRFVENEKTGTNPIAGTFTVSGAITDHGTATGTHFPIFKKVNGQQKFVGVELIQTQHGKHGSFRMDCRDTHLVFKGDQVVKASGRCAFSQETGVYTSLAPIASSVLVPTHPRKGYTHTVRRLSGRTLSG